MATPPPSTKHPLLNNETWSAPPIYEKEGGKNRTKSLNGHAIIECTLSSRNDKG